MRALKILMLPVVVIVVCSAHARAMPSPLWSDLRPGPHAVGFRVVFATDTTRAWQRDQQISGRPVRVSLWYPARVRESARPTPYRSYVVIEAPSAYTSYNEALVRRNLAGLAAAVPGQGLEVLLNTPGRGTSECAECARAVSAHCVSIWFERVRPTRQFRLVRVLGQPWVCGRSNPPGWHNAFAA